LNIDWARLGHIFGKCFYVFNSNCISMISFAVMELIVVACFF
jgi:hypothetical protein